jgi:hypothetical protein
VTAPSTLDADGVVPYVYEPAGDGEFQGSPPTLPPPVQDDQACTADDLSAELSEWVDKSEGVEASMDEPSAGLYGYIVLRAHDDVRCVLGGQTSVTLEIDGDPAPVEYRAASQNLAPSPVVVARGWLAGLRVDWSTPYCGPTGVQTLLIALPAGRGVLAAPVADSSTPVCSRPADGPEGDLRTVVSTGFFTPYDDSAPATSPLASLVVTVEEVPTRVRAGDVLTFRVRVANPTDTDVPLDPCPGYLLERLVVSDTDAVGFNDGALFRLNCRPVSTVAARSAVVFAMETAIPDDPPGPELYVTWGLRYPGLLGTTSSTFFEVPVDP